MSYGNRYWEHETPKEVWTGKSVLAYFEQAGKFQVASTYRKEGEQRRAKVVTLDVEDLAAHPEALALLRDFILEVEGLCE